MHDAWGMGPFGAMQLEPVSLASGSLQGEELPVRGVDAIGLDAVLRFFYTGECLLRYTNVIPIYDCAHRLEVPNLVSACEGFRYGPRVISKVHTPADLVVLNLLRLLPIIV